MTNDVPVNATQPVHGAGALHLLNRAPPADYLRESTERVAAQKQTVEPGTKSVVIFRIGLEWLALPTSVSGSRGRCRFAHGPTPPWRRSRRPREHPR